MSSKVERDLTQVNRIVVFLLVLCCMNINRSAAQEESPNDTVQYGVVGFNQYGSSGVFVLSSPAVLESGQMGGCLTANVGLSWMNDRTTFPLAFAFGVARRIEGYTSFFSSYSRGENEETHSIFGLKVNLLQDNVGKPFISTAFEAQRLEISKDTSGVQDLSAFCGKAIMASHISWGITGYINIGYTMVENKSLNIKNRMVAGGGLVFPFNEYILAGAEIFTPERYTGLSKVAGRFGLKGFLLDHLQLTFGVEIENMSNGFSKGVFFLGVSFSSGQLKVGIRPHSKSPILLPEPPPLEDIPAKDSSSSGSLIVPESNYARSTHCKHIQLQNEGFLMLREMWYEKRS